MITSIDNSSSQSSILLASFRQQLSCLLLGSSLQNEYVDRHLCRLGRVSIVSSLDNQVVLALARNVAGARDDAVLALGSNLERHVGGDETIRYLAILCLK